MTADSGAPDEQPTALTTRPAGPLGLLVELPTAAAAAALHAEILRRRSTSDPLTEVREVVPGARTVLLDGFRSTAARDALAEELPVRPLRLDGPRYEDAPELTLPVRYDGPDLAEVAELWGVPTREVPALHARFRYRVDFCGFAPGFGYLSGLPEEYQVPRRATPRTRVPAGAVAIAGPYTGVYPRTSPGGWRILGTTPAELWDPAREPAALLTPGTWVRFVPEEQS